MQVHCVPLSGQIADNPFLGRPQHGLNIDPLGVEDLAVDRPAAGGLVEIEGPRDGGLADVRERPERGGDDAIVRDVSGDAELHDVYVRVVLCVPQVEGLPELAGEVDNHVQPFAGADANLGPGDGSGQEPGIGPDLAERLPAGERQVVDARA